MAAPSYTSPPRLFEALAMSRGDGRHARLLKTIAREDLLILDDWGLSVLTQNQRIDLLEILEDRNGRGSTIVTSQIPVPLRSDIIGDPTLADAPSTEEPSARPERPPVTPCSDC